MYLYKCVPGSEWMVVVNSGKKPKKEIAHFLSNVYTNFVNNVIAHNTRKKFVFVCLIFFLNGEEIENIERVQKIDDFIWKHFSTDPFSINAN